MAMPPLSQVVQLTPMPSGGVEDFWLLSVCFTVLIITFDFFFICRSGAGMDGICFGSLKGAGQLTTSFLR